MYERIRLASIFLQRVEDNDEIREMDNGEEIIAHYKGEARFLRAYYYWLLMKELGPVAIAPLEPSGPNDNFQIPRSTWDESVAFVLSELNLAKQDLPTEYYVEGTITPDGTQVGRINDIIVEALESRILLYHASPLFNGNTDLANFQNHDGTVLFNQTYDASRWTIAAQAAKEAINLAEANGKSLFRVEGSDPFTSGFLSARNLYWDGWSTEGIWLRPSSNTYQWQVHAAPRSTAGGSYNGLAVVQRLVDDYRMEDGKSIDESTEYHTESYSAETTNYYVEGTNSMYFNREPRFYAHITFNGAHNPGTSKPGLHNSRVEFFNTGTSGKAGSPRDWPKT
ncbi:RagB/SusD family nutrient uptake outer membrane protein [Antarcticibacterium sp. 1MA-6-2]|uniref:RagB/SusD family nutrient uptake outer membrane protein n=1 Tax=Antarcticibacterium sp. 1MA-6-2 TaxID=2908210 RepID=UPI0028831E51|nr:RagB/SusD family nutrient uptake outer membrane protein [Antarcticibacterium sp. 1MA-6-2]